MVLVMDLALVGRDLLGIVLDWRRRLIAEVPPLMPM